MHKNGFGMYLVGASGFTVCVCLIEAEMVAKKLVNKRFSKELVN